MKTNKTLFFLIVAVLSFSATLSSAQEYKDVPAGYVLVDSVVYRPAAVVDTLLSGKDIFHVMPSNVKVNQSAAVETAVRRQVVSNKERQLSGYRVRIFFDNKQTARVESEETLKRFEKQYPDVRAYRTYANPYFKVTVGDFRTRSESVRFLERIKTDFPSAFVVKENIDYPVVDKQDTYIIDTVKVLRRK